MKFTINKADVIDILSKVQGITGKKTNLAITTNVLIQTTENGISISATDLETGFEGYYPAEVESEGIVAINARKFFEIVQNFPNDEIVFNEIENQWIKIGRKSVEYHIVGMDHSSFPEIPKIQEVDFCEVDSGTFKRMIDKVIVIGSPGDEKRAHILGVSVEKHVADDGSNSLRLASTDGKRLSKVDYKLPENDLFDIKENTIIPKKGLQEISRLLDNEGIVDIGIKDNHFVVKKDNETVIVSLLEGIFPNYDTLIDYEDKYSIIIDKHMFLMMLKRMSILSTEEYRSVIFKFSDNNLEITATNPTIGESKEDMAVDFVRETIEVAFNPKFFIDILNMIKEDKVLLNIKSEANPCIIRGINDDIYLNTIMPMKI